LDKFVLAWTVLAPDMPSLFSHRLTNISRIVSPPTLGGVVKYCHTRPATFGEKFGSNKGATTDGEVSEIRSFPARSSTSPSSESPVERPPATVNKIFGGVGLGGGAGMKIAFPTSAMMPDEMKFTEFVTEDRNNFRLLIRSIAYDTTERSSSTCACKCAN
jgi:hypothetical protein